MTQGTVVAEKILKILKANKQTNPVSSLLLCGLALTCLYGHSMSVVGVIGAPNSLAFDNQILL